MADSGFPVGGAPKSWGGANSQGGYVLKNVYVKTKESAHLGGAGGAPAAPLWSANVLDYVSRSSEKVGFQKEKPKRYHTGHKIRRL